MMRRCGCNGEFCIGASISHHDTIFFFQCYNTRRIKGQVGLTNMLAEERGWL